MRRAVAAMALALAVCGDPASAQDAVAEPEGYRLQDYRAAVPATLRGATVVSTAEVEALAGEAVLIDVLPRPPRPKALSEKAVWRPRPRSNIPGSVWLPNTGFGILPITVEAYFQKNLEALSGGDRARKLVFYCLADCWMSWNAAKRALSYGYRQVYWYPEGTDAWSAAGLPLEASEPVPEAE